MGTLKIIMVAYRRIIPLRIAIDSFLNQAEPSWELHIIHDGPAQPEIKAIVDQRPDPRLHFLQTTKVNGRWGHPNRRYMLRRIEALPEDYILITNDDNYYVPIFVKTVKSYMKHKPGIIYYNTLHNYFGYTVHHSKLKVGSIDMGAFAVRADVAKAVGFKHDQEVADGYYAEECATYCRERGLQMIYIPNMVPFIHN